MKPIYSLALILLVAVSAHAQKKNPECKNGDLSPYHFRHDHDINGITGLLIDTPDPAKCVQGRWVLDSEALAQRKKDIADAEAKAKAVADHKLDLWNALRTRVLTDSEMQEVLKQGTDIIPPKDGGGSIDWCGGASSCQIPGNYQQVENDRERNAEIIFNNALLNQFKMRVFQEKAGEVSGNSAGAECVQRAMKVAPKGGLVIHYKSTDIKPGAACPSGMHWAQGNEIDDSLPRDSKGNMVSGYGHEFTGSYSDHDYYFCERNIP